MDNHCTRTPKIESLPPSILFNYPAFLSKFIFLPDTSVWHIQWLFFHLTEAEKLAILPDDCIKSLLFLQHYELSLPLTSGLNVRGKDAVCDFICPASGVAFPCYSGNLAVIMKNPNDPTAGTVWRQILVYGIFCTTRCCAISSVYFNLYPVKINLIPLKLLELLHLKTNAVSVL